MAERICKRCLLYEINDDEFSQSIYSYIENLPDEMKCSAELVEYRLSKCKACDDLVNGMCRLCGCFVEVRAVKKSAYCAKNKSIW